MKQIVINVNPYPIKLLVLIGNKKDINKKLEKLTAEKLEHCAISIRLHNKKYNYVLCLDSKNINHCILAHELIHITWFMDNDLTLNFSSKSDEQQAYLVSYLMNKIINPNK